MLEISPSGSGSGKGRRSLAQSTARHRAPSRLHVRRDSAPFQRVKDPPRSGLRGPGSYPDDRAVPKGDCRSSGDKRRMQVRRQVCRPQPDPRRAGEDRGGLEILDPNADPAVSWGRPRPVAQHVCPDENRASNQSAGFGGVQVVAWTHGKGREARDGPPDGCCAWAQVAGRRGAHRSVEAP